MGTPSKSPLGLEAIVVIVYISCLLGIIWAIFNWISIRKIQLRKDQ